MKLNYYKYQKREGHWRKEINIQEWKKKDIGKWTDVDDEGKQKYAEEKYKYTMKKRKYSI